VTAYHFNIQPFEYLEQIVPELREGLKGLQLNLFFRQSKRKEGGATVKTDGKIIGLVFLPGSNEYLRVQADPWDYITIVSRLIEAIKQDVKHIRARYRLMKVEKV
jgi:hypothetical protein